MGTSAGSVRSALPAVIRTAIADSAVQVSLGFPWPQAADDIVSVGTVRATLESATVGPQRTRDETVTVEVLISTFRAGGEEQEAVASDRAYALLDRIEHHLRTVDPTLGGLVRQCLLTSHDMDSAPFDDGVSQGRTVEVLATLTARYRVAN